MNKSSAEQSSFGRSLEEEANLGRDIYFAPKYFERTQLFSQAAQINAIHGFGVREILEIGPGNGFAAEFLRAAGYKVDTVDVNLELNPTFVGSVLELDQIVAPYSYDLVVCCEVLEHLPFASFPTALNQIAKATRKFAFITLPQSKKFLFSLSGLLTVPSRGSRWFCFAPSLGRKNPIYENHHWELGWKPEHRISKICEIMSEKFHVEKVNAEPMNPYHVFFKLAVKHDSR